VYTGCPATVAIAVPSGVAVRPVVTVSFPAPPGETAGQNCRHCDEQVEWL
jgi:hypothetical protein